MKLLIIIIIIISVILIIVYIQTKTSVDETTIENKESSDLIKKSGENWWKNVFIGDWDGLFNNTVDENNNKLSYECQNKIKTAYEEFVGNTYLLEIEDARIPCASVKDASLPSSNCIAVKYSLNNKLGNFTNYLFFVNAENEWKVQIDCKQYDKRIALVVK